MGRDILNSPQGIKTALTYEEELVKSVLRISENFLAVSKRIWNLAIPETSMSISTSDVLKDIRKLRIQIAKISDRLRTLEDQRAATWIDSCLGATREIEKSLSAAYRKVSLGAKSTSLRVRVSNAWEAQEILSNVEHRMFEGLLKDVRIISLLAKPPDNKRLVVFEGIMRTWDYPFEGLGRKIRTMPYSGLVAKDSGKRFYDGGVETVVTIISVAANIGTLAKILYDYFRKRRDRDRPSVIRIKKEKEVIYIDFRNASIEKIREVLKRCIVKPRTKD